MKKKRSKTKKKTVRASGLSKMKKKRASKKEVKVAYKIRPVSASFTITSILGTILVIVYTASGRIALSWGVAFGSAFLIMFIASLFSLMPLKSNKT